MFIIYVCGNVACQYVCASHVYLVPVEARRSPGFHGVGVGEVSCPVGAAVGATSLGGAATALIRCAVSAALNIFITVFYSQVLVAFLLFVLRQSLLCPTLALNLTDS